MEKTNLRYQRMRLIIEKESMWILLYGAYLVALFTIVLACM
ncbi:hypothetical protein [Prevotella sp. E13-17]|nr:hypothetical protein [Prevotella sp. E13-17]